MLEELLRVEEIIGEIENELRVRGCVSGPVQCSSSVCQDKTTVEPSSGSSFFALSDFQFFFSSFLLFLFSIFLCPTFSLYPIDLLLCLVGLQFPAILSLPLPVKDYAGSSGGVVATLTAVESTEAAKVMAVATSRATMKGEAKEAVEAAVARAVF